MMMERLWMLNFLWLLPLVVLVLVVENRKKKKTMERFADPALLERLTAPDHRGRQREQVSSSYGRTG